MIKKKKQLSLIKKTTLNKIMKIKIYKFIIIFFISSSCASYAHVYDYVNFEKEKILSRTYQPKMELSGNVNFNNNGTFERLTGFNINITHLFTTLHGWEIVDANFLTGINSQLGKKIKSKLGPDSEFEKPERILSTHWVYTPFYGKSALNQSFFSTTNLGFLFGIGQMTFHQTQNSLLSVGLKNLWIFKENQALRLDLKYLRTIPAKDYFESLVFVSLGWSVSL